MGAQNLAKLPTFDAGSRLVNVVIETSKNSRTKLKYDEQRDAFIAEKVLPMGLVFPFDFGFLPSTQGAMATRSMCWRCGGAKAGQRMVQQGIRTVQQASNNHNKEE
jgi:Inorganic pyrophosphatase